MLVRNINRKSTQNARVYLILYNKQHKETDKVDSKGSGNMNAFPKVLS